jgi:hypothetical protein
MSSRQQSGPQSTPDMISAQSNFDLKVDSSIFCCTGVTCTANGWGETPLFALTV